MNEILDNREAAVEQAFPKPNPERTMPHVEQAKDGTWWAVDDNDDDWVGPFSTEAEAQAHALGVDEPAVEAVD